MRRPTRPQSSGGSAPGRRRRRSLALGGALAAVALLAGLVVTTARGGDQDSGTSRPVAAEEDVRAWREGVRQDYQALAGSALPALQATAAWGRGETSATEAASAARAARTGARSTQSALADRPAPAGAEDARRQFQVGAALYTATFGLVEAAAAVDDRPLQQQLRLSAARTRDLGDRVFEQANDAVKLLLPAEPSAPDVDVRRVADVTDYASVDLAPGPPLETEPPPPRPLRSYQQVRPEQSVADWERAVGALDVPGTEEIEGLLGTSDPQRLAGAARGLVDDANALHDMPDPEDGRRRSTQLQLALLVEAEALRAAQAAVLAPEPLAERLLPVARELHATATRLREAQPA